MWFLDLLANIGDTLPKLHGIIDDIARLAEAGSNCADEPHLIEVTLPMLCSYLPVWWKKNQAQKRMAELAAEKEAANDRGDDETEMHRGSMVMEEIFDDESDAQMKVVGATEPITTVTADLMNRVLGSVLQLIQNNID